METLTLTVPQSWTDINLKTFLKFQTYKSEGKILKDSINKMAIILNIEPSELLSLDTESLTQLMEDMKWIGDVPECDNVTEWSDPDSGMTYALESANRLSAGAWCDIEDFHKAETLSTAKVLSVIFRPIVKRNGNSIEIEKYDIKSVESRAELFMEKMPTSVAYSLCLIFGKSSMLAGKNAIK